MKKFGFMMLMAAVMFLASNGNALAKECGKCAASGSMEHKVFKKVEMIKDHQADLQFSDADVKKAVDLKKALKKDLIKMDADLEVLMVDLKSAKYADPLDVNAINALIDQKYEIKKKKAKRVVEAYAAVKGMFTADQKTKMKEMYAQKDKKQPCAMCMKKHKHDKKDK